MQVVITGGSGFVGTQLGRFLLQAGHGVTALGTRPAFNDIAHPNFRYVRADTTRSGSWQEVLKGADLVVNLAGATIFSRWSQRYKRQIYDSRILTTRLLAEGLAAGGPTILISASAVGYYGSCGEGELGEDSPKGNDFLAKVAADWEAAALAAAGKGVRVVLARFGIVLGQGGGALASMLPAFRAYVGGPLGSGRQWFPWIHMADLLQAIDFLAARADLSGPFNLCAPNPVRNADLARTLGQVLGRAAVLSVPAFAIKMALGELGTVLLGSQRVLPLRLLQSGFTFRFPNLTEALKDLLRAA
jgi:uncharacterized protein (TIGR01777 family)